jgi:hypothetical protein
MYLTAIGACSFLAGVALRQKAAGRAVIENFPISSSFPKFCLNGGLFATFALFPVTRIPSIGAAVDKAGALWILGVVLGLRSASLSGRSTEMLYWLTAMLVYPILMLLMSGFLSYGTAAVLIAISGLAIVARSIWRVWFFLVLITVFGLSVFANYYVARDSIRAVIWSDAGWSDRVEVTISAFANFEPLALADPTHLRALDERLNQNFFVGLAAERLADGAVDYKWGWSLAEAAISLVPRMIWPDKPVYGGSPAIVREMTGMDLSDSTSWGVGNVMEFYINFNIAGVIVGFILLGMILGQLDRASASALARGDHENAIVYFLPAVALIQPIGSLVEIVSGSAAAFVGALAWKWAWSSYHTRHLKESRLSEPLDESERSVSGRRTMRRTR